MKPEAFFLYNQACEKEKKQQIASQCSMPQSSELSTDAHQKKISEIIPGKLYLGNYSASQDKGLLQRYGITNIINITVTGACSFPEDFRYLNIKMADSQGGIEPHLKKVVDFIEQGKTVFVHCRYGVSRSSSLVIAYLMYKNQ